MLRSYAGHRKTNYCANSDRDFTIALLEGCEVGTFVFLDSPATDQAGNEMPFQFRAVVNIQSIYHGMTTQPQAFWIRKYHDKYMIVWGKTARIDHFMPEVLKSIGLDKHLPFNRFFSPDEIVEHLLKYLKPYPNPEVLDKLRVANKLPGSASEAEKTEALAPSAMPAPQAEHGHSQAVGTTTELKTKSELATREGDESKQFNPASHAALVSGLAGNVLSGSVNSVGAVSLPITQLTAKIPG